MTLKSVLHQASKLRQSQTLTDQLTAVERGEWSLKQSSFRLKTGSSGTWMCLHTHITHTHKTVQNELLCHPSETAYLHLVYSFALRFLLEFHFYVHGRISYSSQSIDQPKCPSVYEQVFKMLHTESCIYTCNIIQP